MSDDNQKVPPVKEMWSVDKDVLGALLGNDRKIPDNVFAELFLDMFVDPDNTPNEVVAQWWRAAGSLTSAVDLVDGTTGEFILEIPPYYNTSLLSKDFVKNLAKVEESVKRLPTGLDATKREVRQKGYEDIIERVTVGQDPRLIKLFEYFEVIPSREEEVPEAEVNEDDADLWEEV